jgi:lambda family phage holin
MPDRILNFLHSMEPEAGGVLMAIFISMLRVIYDKDETRVIRVLLESFLCGAVALTINSGVVALGFGHSWAVFIGGSVGYFGSARIRIFAMDYLSRKAGKKK